MMMMVVFIRRTKRSACWRSGPDSADQTGCTASETGCVPAAGGLEEPAYWKRCGPAVAPPGCTTGTVPATQTPPTVDRCHPGRRKCPAGATTPRANFPTECWSLADAACRPELPKMTMNCLPCHRLEYSWREHVAERPLRLALPCHRHHCPSCSGWPRQQLLQRLRQKTTTTKKKACIRLTIPACGRCSGARTTTTLKTRVGPTRSVCPPEGIRTRQTLSVPAWAHAACGSSWTMTTPGDTHSGPWPADASSAIDPRAART